MSSQTTQSNQDVIALIERVGVVPLITLNAADEAEPLAHALERAEVPIAEVTFRSPYALDGMRAIRNTLPDVMLVAGTVHNVEQAKASVEAGCRGIVTPSFDREVVGWCLANHVPVIPGTATPSDVEKVYDSGLRHAKFFPAEAYGGVKTLKALYGPFAEVSFLPTGGVNLGNAADYIQLPNVFAVGGSFPVPGAAQKARDWDAVERAARAARKLVAPFLGR